MNVQGPIIDALREYMNSNALTQLVVIVLGFIVVILFIVWAFNRFFVVFKDQIDTQRQQITNQQRQLDISEKNAETSRMTAITMQRQTTTLEEITDTMRSSNHALAMATAGIGDVGRGQAATNELITSTASATVTTVINELTTVEKSFELFFDAAKNPASAIFAAMRESLRPEFDRLNKGLSDLKALLPLPPPVLPPPAPAPTPTPLPVPIPTPSPTTPTRPPTMPIQTEDMLVHEDWSAARLYEGNDTDPARRWIKALSPDEAHAGAALVPYAGGKALELSLVPDSYGQQAGARVFYTNSGRWDTLAGLDTLYVRYAVQTPEALNIDEGDGTGGKWATVGVQLKDEGATVNALVQMNARTVDGETYARLGFADGGVIQSDPFAYPVGQWVIVDLVIPLRKDKTAKVWALFDGVLKLTGIARTLDAVSGKAGWGLALYSNALYAPARALVGWIVASKTPIPDPVGKAVTPLELDV